jgi:ABC-type bacteriocin/lantibiotic exporter with double-glycine peptidase domain
MEGMETRWTDVAPREALRFAFVDEQGWDASCGYAALATLLRRYRGIAVTEAELLARSGGVGETLVAVSLAKLLELVRAEGLTARAGRTDYEGLLALTGPPWLVHYDRPQAHFALVLAQSPTGVVTADPARGMELLTRSQFLERWSGVVVVVSDPANRGSEAVDTAVANTLRRAALVERALSKGPGKR